MAFRFLRYFRCAEGAQNDKIQQGRHENESMIFALLSPCPNCGRECSPIFPHSQHIARLSPDNNKSDRRKFFLAQIKK